MSYATRETNQRNLKRTRPGRWKRTGENQKVLRSKGSDPARARFIDNLIRQARKPK